VRRQWLIRTTAALVPELKEASSLSSIENWIDLLDPTAAELAAHLR
jgi:hypothetical protein